jgi:hypothetical protein
VSGFGLKGTTEGVLAQTLVTSSPTKFGNDQIFSALDFHPPVKHFPFQGLT